MTLYEHQLILSALQTTSFIELYKWLDAPCQCPRCLAEEEIARNQPKSANLWDDVHEKVVFPEDLLKN